MAFKKNSRHKNQNLLKLSPVSECSAHPLQNYVWFSTLTYVLESFGHKYIWQALDWGLLSKILASMKMGGAKNAESSTF